MSKLLFLTFIITLSSVSPKNINNQRHPRGIWGPHTKTITETSFLKTFVPSSCVLVDPTLPPCRHVRYLNFPNFVSNPFVTNNNNNAVAKTEEINSLQTTSLDWGEYLGIYAPTVTLTETKVVTTVVEDPNVVVTFAVKGCQPSKLPNDINKCQQPEQSVEITGIVPTSTVSINNVITPTQNVNSFDENISSRLGVYENNEFHHRNVAPSLDEVVENKHAKTEELPL